jgi:hypothetical protein
VLGQSDTNKIAQLEEKTTENLAEATNLHTSYKENMRIASTVSSLFDITGSLRSSLSFLRALPYVDTASRRSTWRPGYWPQVAIATAVVARWRTDAGRALLYKGTRLGQGYEVLEKERYSLVFWWHGNSSGYFIVEIPHERFEVENLVERQWRVHSLDERYKIPICARV